MKKKNDLYFFIAILVIIVFSIISIVNNNYSISPLLPLLPVLYLLCFIIIFAKRPTVLKSTSVMIIMSIFFIRIVIIPAIYVLSGYSSKISVNSTNLNYATLLQMWEFFWVFIMLLVSKKISKLNENKQKIDTMNIDKTKGITKLAILILVLIAIICVLKDRNVLVVISTIFNRFFGTTEDAITRRVLFLELNSKSSLVFNVFFQSVFYLQILIPAYLVAVMAQKKMKKDDKGFYGILLISIISIIFVTDNNIDSICIMIACLIVMYNLYEEKTKKFLPFIGTVLTVFVLLFLFSKTGILTNDMDLKSISRTLSAYFAALPNISLTFAMSYTNKIKTFFGDIIAGVPYLMAIIKNYPQSLHIYNTTLYGYEGMSDQIMPLISYGYQYLGLLAPLFTISSYGLALNLENKSNCTKSAFNKVLYSLMFINLSIGPCIFGFPNIIKRICLYIPLLLLININEKRKQRNSSNEK